MGEFRSEGNRVAIACRCQMITGSYEGATRCCPCKGRDECYLSKKARDLLKHHPRVKEATKRNRKEFAELCESSEEA